MTAAWRGVGPPAKWSPPPVFEDARQPNGQLDRARAAPADDHVADMRCERRCRVISDDRATDHALDSRRAGAVHQPLEQRCPNAAPLPRIGDDDRELSEARIMRVAHVPRDPDSGAALGFECDERFVATLKFTY